LTIKSAQHTRKQSSVVSCQWSVKTETAGLNWELMTENWKLPVNRFAFASLPGYPLQAVEHFCRRRTIQFSKIAECRELACAAPGLNQAQVNWRFSIADWRLKPNLAAITDRQPLTAHQPWTLGLMLAAKRENQTQHP